MQLFNSAKQTTYKFLFSRFRHRFSAADPAEIQRISEKAVLLAFHRAHRRSPAYARLLKESGVHAARIRTIQDFTAEVPILDKKALYARFRPEEMFPELRTESAGRVWTSSGSSGFYSFGLETPKQLSATGLSIDFLLDYIFDITAHKTLFINCLPNPWPIAVRCAHIANVGTRTDVANFLIKKMSGVYSQLILGGEPLLLKKILEEGIQNGIDFSKIIIHLAIGGEFCAEHLRQYLLKLLGELPSTVRHKKRIALLSMGLAEFGIGVFFELPPLAHLRARLLSDRTSFDNEFETVTAFPPQMFQYNPYATFVETTQDADGRSRIVLTNLSSKTGFPFVRYNTFDAGHIFSHSKVARFLSTHYPNLDTSLLFPFPVVFSEGKATSVPISQDTALEVDEAKELLFSFDSMCNHITGCFRISNDTDSSATEMLVQLKPGIDPATFPLSVFAGLQTALQNRKIALALVPYHQFPTSMELSFEKKFEYL